MTNGEDEIQPGLNITEDNVHTTSEVSNMIKLETSMLENKYFKWIISIGIAFLILKSIDTAVDMSYIKGKQESFDQTITTLFESRDKVIEELKEKNNKLKNELDDKYILELQVERLKFDNDKLKSKGK